MVEFTLNRDGSIKSLKILKATGPGSLKNAAVKAIKLSALFPSFPDLSLRQTWSFKTSLEYRLH